MLVLNIFSLFVRKKYMQIKLTSPVVMFICQFNSTSLPKLLQTMGNFLLTMKHDCRLRKDSDLFKRKRANQKCNLQMHFKFKF